jgi:predicted membrane protein
MLRFIIAAIALFLQLLSNSFLSSNKDSNSRYAYWANVFSIIFSLIATVLSVLIYLQHIKDAF